MNDEGNRSKATAAALVALGCLLATPGLAVRRDGGTTLDGAWRADRARYTLAETSGGSLLSVTVANDGLAGEGEGRLERVGPRYFVGDFFERVGDDCRTRWNYSFHVVGPRHIDVRVDGNDGACGVDPATRAAFSLYRG